MSAGVCWPVLISALLGRAGGAYPLAAAQVIDGKVYIADVPTRSVTPVPFDGLIPEEADLSPNKTFVAVTARNGTEPARLYIIKVGTWERKLIETSATGAHKTPHLAEAGKSVLFAATPFAADAGPGNALRRYRLSVREGIVEQVPSTEAASEYSAVGLAGGRIAYLPEGRPGQSAELVVAAPLSEEPSRRLASFIAQPEVASSPGGSRIVIFQAIRHGTEPLLIDGDSAARRIATIPATGRLQPRFICPRDVVLTVNGLIWALSTKTQILRDLMPAAQQDF